MNQALHFAWWLTVPGSDEQLVQLYATGASPAVKCDVDIGRQRFRPKPSPHPNASMPPVFWWKNGGAVYNARVTFEDGSVVVLPALDMRPKARGAMSSAAEQNCDTVCRGLAISKPIVATTPWGEAKYDLWVDGCTFNGGGVGNIDNWFPGWRAVYITNCAFEHCMSGPQGSNVELVRSVFMQSIGGDALSDARVVWDVAIADHVKGRADLHPDTYQFRSRGPQVEPKLLAGIRDQSKGSQGIFADRSTFVRNAAIVQCRIGTDGVGVSLQLAAGCENVLIDDCRFDVGPTDLPNRSNVVIRKSTGVR